MTVNLVRSTALMALAAALVAGCATPPESAPAPAPAAPVPASPPSPSVSVIEGNAWTPRMEQLSLATQQAKGVEAAKTPRNEVRIRATGEYAFQKGTQSTLSPSLVDFLDRLAATLAPQPQFHVRVVGHTDNVGSDAVNDRISLERAKVVVDHLVSRGMSAERVKAEGRGEAEPLTANDTPQNRALNRRVELLVTEPVGP